MTRASEVAALIHARIGQIRKAAGYETDIGATVYRGRRKMEPSSIPLSTIVELDDVVREHGAAANVRLALRFSIEAYDRCDPDNPNDQAHRMIGDLKRAVFSEPRKLDGEVKELTYRGRGIQPRDDGQDFVSVNIEIEVEIREDLSAP